ncbi:MAG: hypothetical protein ABS81_09890 [Pseudonocardia sp. SCN 72-86]|nr:MAG: hypothetical protein ABS81_09890 [Pseudonocardia sp. SCN 72-86]
MTLDVWSPADLADGPVLVWLDDEPRAARRARRFCAGLAAEHGLVVVAPRRRRGAFGYLDLTALRDGHGNGNFGLLDQLEALTWVATHARAFGGDPAAITVSGRGEGAHAAALLAGLPRTNPLVRRLALPEGMPGARVHTPSQAARVAASFLGLLGADPGGRGDLRELEAAVIVRTETALRRAEGRAPFGLVAHDDLPFDDVAQMLDTAASSVEVMVGGGVCGESDACSIGRNLRDRSGSRGTDRGAGVSAVVAATTSWGYGGVLGAFARAGGPRSASGPAAARLHPASVGTEPVDLGVVR